AVGAGSLNVKSIVLPVLSLLIISSLLGANLTSFRPVDIPVGKSPTKEIYNALNAPSIKGQIIETRWSAFGRTDLVNFRNYPEQMDIYIDGTSGTPMYRFSGDINKPDPAIDNLKTDFPGYLALAFLKTEERDNALIIGPGGGRDILLALMGGVGKISAVEVNKELVDIVREYAWYNGGIYTDLDNVSVYVDEGRN
ncbi:MAG: hypothetical protein GWN81_26585, partial [Phycisphaerae bacterium]|nr:hypothetical protein [Phycisphaerae bacterium]